MLVRPRAPLLSFARHLPVTRAAALALGAAAAACGPASPPLGPVDVSLGGTPLAGAAEDAPTTLELTLTAGRALAAGDVAVSLDGRALTPRLAGATATATVSPLALGSHHEVQVDAGDYHQRQAFQVIGVTGIEAAVHVEGGSAVVDIVFEHALTRAGMAALPAQGAQPAWSDPRHARLAWPVASRPDVFVVPGTLEVDRGSRLAGPVRLPLKALPGTGALRRVTVPPAPPVRASKAAGYVVATAASRASVAGNGGRLTEVSPAGWGLTTDGVTGTPDAGAVAAASQVGRPVWPLVQNDWGTADVLGAALADASTRDRLTAAIAAAVKAGGFPGIHLDIENVPPGSRADLTRLVAATARALHQEGARIAVDVVPHRAGHLPRVAAAYDLPAITAAVDKVIFMAYDEHVGADDPGPVAGLDWDTELLDGSLPGLDRGKVWLGLPLYSRTWNSGDVTADSYGHATYVALTSGPAYVDYDFAAATPFVLWGAAEANVTYFDDTDSLARKIALGQGHGLGGVAVWRLGFEDPGFWSLVAP